MLYYITHLCMFCNNLEIIKINSFSNMINGQTRKMVKKNELKVCMFAKLH